MFKWVTAEIYSPLTGGRESNVPARKEWKHVQFGVEILLPCNLNIALSAIFLTSSPYDDDGEKALPIADMQKIMQGSIIRMIRMFR